MQSVEVAGRILSVLVDSTKPMMLRDIADAAGLPPGQAHPYIVSFRKIGLVEQDGASGLYRLGWFALHLGLRGCAGSIPINWPARPLPTWRSRWTWASRSACGAPMARR